MPEKYLSLWIWHKVNKRRHRKGLVKNLNSRPRGIVDGIDSESIKKSGRNQLQQLGISEGALIELDIPNATENQSMVYLWHSHCRLEIPMNISKHISISLILENENNQSSESLLEEAALYADEENPHEGNDLEMGDAANFNNNHISKSKDNNRNDSTPILTSLDSASPSGYMLQQPPTTSSSTPSQEKPVPLSNLDIDQSAIIVGFQYCDSRKQSFLEEFGFKPNRKVSVIAHEHPFLIVEVESPSESYSSSEYNLPTSATTNRSATKKEKNDDVVIDSEEDIGNNVDGGGGSGGKSDASKSEKQQQSVSLVQQTSESETSIRTRLSIKLIHANKILVRNVGQTDRFVRSGYWESFKESTKEAFSARSMRDLATFLGPAFLVSVGYADPGNWATDLEAGARFGYKLLWVILMSNIMAIILQVLSAKLGIATGKSLPENCRESFPRWANLFLWITAELAAMATDLAEFLGAAIGFGLLFNIPYWAGALLTGVCVLIILALERFGVRKVELIIILLVTIIAVAYIVEMVLVQPDADPLFQGMFIPSLPAGSTLVAVGIVGATVMPHNLYLHSGLMRTRIQSTDSIMRKRRVVRMATVESVFALNAAFFVNSAILIMSAGTFSEGRLEDYSLTAAHQTLTPLLGSIASACFAIALLASGLASSTTATIAGQIIMQGFIRRELNVWLRRLITMVPSLIVIAADLDAGSILVFSQVALSFQLPFAVLPLVYFTSKKSLMGEFVNGKVTIFVSVLISLAILAFNVVLLVETISSA